MLDVPNVSYIEQSSNTQQFIQIILIAISTVFGALLIASIFVYYAKTRHLKRQLKALSTTDFGSNSSGLNRQKAPTTNVFSVEGSNPVLNDNELAKGAFDSIRLVIDSFF